LSGLSDTNNRANQQEMVILVEMQDVTNLVNV